MKKLICKIFGHFRKTETTKYIDGIGFTTFNYKYTCKICGKIETGAYTSIEGPTMTLTK